MTPYTNTLSVFQNADPRYEFLDSDILSVFQQQSGQDITKALNTVLATKNSTTQQANMACLKNMFFVGNTDFRKTPRCQVQNGLLLAFSVVIMTTIGAKCKSLSMVPMYMSLTPFAVLAALQLTSKRQPEMLDKFVIC